ncbi:polycystin-1-like protein 2 [Pseudophryne corroboree]|uniref:polycystin-1-like protein 2 n=1 Tax=Pseudophryne corroboree TaxID=495146 RepID=UPI00308163F5
MEVAQVGTYVAEIQEARKLGVDQEQPRILVLSDGGMLFAKPSEVDFIKESQENFPDVVGEWSKETGVSYYTTSLPEQQTLQEPSDLAILFQEQPIGLPKIAMTVRNTHTAGQSAGHSVSYDSDPLCQELQEVLGRWIQKKGLEPVKARMLEILPSLQDWVSKWKPPPQRKPESVLNQGPRRPSHRGSDIPHFRQIWKRCHRCGQGGHLRRECPRKKGQYDHSSPMGVVGRSHPRENKHYHPDAPEARRVCLSLCGLHDHFGPILLSDSRHEVFKKGNADIFSLSVPFPLGDLKSITLSHDGTGSHTSWYVAQVTVQDVQLKRSWHFMCNTWLSKPPRGDSLSKTFTSAEDQELKSFRNIFLKRTIRGLRDDHIWISVLNHSARSVFTRVQKVSCCMCLLLCTIVINLMFWEMPQAKYPVLISVGSFILTWKDIMIAFESALLMFPVNLLIIYIFRNTRPKESGTSKAKTKKCRQISDAKKCPTRQLNIDTVLEDLSGIVWTLSQTSWNNLEVDLSQESNGNFTILLQTISNLLRNQITPGLLAISVPLAQLPNDELHALFCAHYVSRKLRKVFYDLQQLRSQQTPDNQQYDELIAVLQRLLHVLDKSVPSLPARRPPQKQEIKRKRLPWWFLLIGWSLLISISVVSTYFTMMYGFLYGKQSSIRWIISMALSLFQSIFILQPLKVVGFAVFFALVLKKVDEEEEDLLDGELGTSADQQVYRERDDDPLCPRIFKGSVNYWERARSCDDRLGFICSFEYFIEMKHKTIPSLWGTFTKQ